MYFIYKKDCIVLGGKFLDNILEPLLEFTPVLGSCKQCPQVQGIYLNVLKGRGNLSLPDFPGKSLCKRSLTHSRVANKDGVVLPAPAKDLHGALDLLIPAYQGIYLSRGRLFTKIYSKPGKA